MRLGINDNGSQHQSLSFQPCNTQLFQEEQKLTYMKSPFTFITAQKIPPIFTYGAEVIIFIGTKFTTF